MGGKGRKAGVGDFTTNERHLVEKGRKGKLRLSSLEEDRWKDEGVREGEGGERPERDRVEPEAVGEHCGPEG